MPVVRVILREGQEKLYHEAQASIHTRPVSIIGTESYAMHLSL